MRIGLCCLAVAIVVSGCQHRTPDQQLIRDLGPATSWIATLDLASESWVGNRVPSAFMDNSIHAAQMTLEQAMQSVDGSRASAPLRQRVRAQLRVAEDAAGELRGAVHRTDRGAAIRARARFISAYQALNALEEPEQP